MDVFHDHRKYLAFAWDFGDWVLMHFQFVVFPFVFFLSAPYSFTKLFKPVVTSWSCKGFSMVIFLMMVQEVARAVFELRSIV